jgi:rSAM/selenodomain-associated transferase 1
VTSETTVLVMAKAPVAGRVKTRLCPPCSPGEAAAVAGAALVDTLDAVLSSGAARRLLALDGEPGDWLAPGFEVVAQRGASFNERLQAAWAEVDGPCIQIGMDTPQVTGATLDHALQVLDTYDAALGPATDGGWWALALRGPCPQVFAGVPMSTARTGEAQIAELRRHGLDPAVLAPLRDIDTMDDALAVAATLPGSRTHDAVAAVRRRVGR